MKTTSALLFLLLCVHTVQAQIPTEKELKAHQTKVSDSKTKGTVVLSLDTIFNAGKPYAILKKVNKNITPDYRLYSLFGNELMDIIRERTINEITYYAYIFLQSGKRAEARFYWDVRVEKLIVENDLVHDSIINPAGENRFLLKYPPNLSTMQNQQIVNINVGGTPTYTNPYQTVDRNRNRMIQIFGSEIRQEQILIGTYNRTTTFVNGKALDVYSFYLPNGTKVAEATQLDVRSTMVKVVTMKDNFSRTVNTTYIGRGADDLAKYLSTNYYL
jgi:hypothetical protein